MYKDEIKAMNANYKKYGCLKKPNLFKRIKWFILKRRSKKQNNRQLTLFYDTTKFDFDKEEIII